MTEKKKSTELQTIPSEQPTELVLIMQAIDKLGGENAESAVAVIKELSKMKRDQERWDAKKEFYTQLSEFQNECPPIKKDSVAEVLTKSGGKYSYKYAKIDKIERVVKPLLMHRGFSYSWDSKTDNKQIEVVCCLRHKNGHEITASATAPIPDSLAAMNIIQIPATVRSYLERGTMVQVLGLTTADEDTDATLPANPVTKEQLTTLEQAVKDSIPPSALPRFLKLFKVAKLSEMSQNDYDFGLKKLASFKANIDKE